MTPAADLKRYEALLALAEQHNRRLSEQLRIASDALEHIVQIADRGARASLIGVYAHDALIQMSVVE